MQQVRIVLFAALAGLLLLLWDAWQTQYGSRGETASSDSATESAESAAGDGKDARVAPDPDTDATTTDASPENDGSADAPGESDGGGRIAVDTDVLALEISERGGAIVQARLKKHTVSVDNDEPFTLMKAASPKFIAELGISSKNGEAPGLEGEWTAERDRYRLKPGDDRLVVPMTWEGADGTRIQRRYILRRDSYVVDVEHEITNATGSAQDYYQYTRLRRAPTSIDQAFLGARSFIGGVISTPQDPYTKWGFDDIKDGAYEKSITDGWVAMIQHYFVVAAIPPRDDPTTIYTARSGGDRILGLAGASWQNVAPDETLEVENRLFIGPKEQNRLDAVANNLELTVDYGWFHVLSKPLFELLQFIHGIVGNWGWSIVILVLLIKLVFYKLSETSYRSMARMRKLQPKMQELRERYSDDKQRMNQEIMELYKNEKVNPLGGCLPILLQIPVFIALYWVLLESVELRQAPWILWIDDLATRDDYYILPLLMGLTMFLQQKLNPAPMDPLQQKVMMALPVVFTVFFMFFPAGLVLYWVTNNSLSILQQWIITRRIEAGDDDDGDGQGGGGGIKRLTQGLRSSASR